MFKQCFVYLLTCQNLKNQFTIVGEKKTMQTYSILYTYWTLVNIRSFAKSECKEQLAFMSDFSFYPRVKLLNSPHCNLCLPITFKWETESSKLWRLLFLYVIHLKSVSDKILLYFVPGFVRGNNWNFTLVSCRNPVLKSLYKILTVFLLKTVKNKGILSLSVTLRTLWGLI